MGRGHIGSAQYQLLARTAPELNVLALDGVAYRSHVTHAHVGLVEYSETPP